MTDLYQTLAECHPKLKRGLVYCHACGRTQKVDAAECFRSGWPECCSQTMSLDETENSDEDTKTGS